MSRAGLRALMLIAAVLATPAAAQTGRSTSGNIGSAAISGGYPTGGGAVTLPNLATGTTATTSAGTATVTTTPTGTATSITGNGITGAAGTTSGTGGGSGTG